jgi:hypothetical protein
MPSSAATDPTYLGLASRFVLQNVITSPATGRLIWAVGGFVR